MHIFVMEIHLTKINFQHALMLTMLNGNWIKKYLKTRYFKQNFTKIKNKEVIQKYLNQNYQRLKSAASVSSTSQMTNTKETY